MQEIFESKDIVKIIPHRYPFLLVDRIKNFEKNKSCIGIKNVSINEQFFQGHFPDNPVMPGVLLIEAMAQTGTFLVAKSLDAKQDEKGVFFTGIDNVKFRKPVIPGDVLEIHVTIKSNKMNIWFCDGVCYVEGKKVIECTFSAMIYNKNK